MDKIKLEKMQNLPIIGDQPRNEKEEKWLREIVEYEFDNSEDPGLKLKFVYGSTKQNEVIEIWPGVATKLPRFIARYVESRGYPMYKYSPDGSGAMVPTYIGKQGRFRMREVFKGM